MGDYKLNADFVRTARYLKAGPAAEGSYYIVEQKPRFATMGGLWTNSELNVVKQDGTAIPDFYAAGASLGRTLTSDRVAAAFTKVIL